jgi:hypothetical protein
MRLFSEQRESCSEGRESTGEWQAGVERLRVFKDQGTKT